MDTVTAVTLADTVELWPVHDAVLGDQPSYDAWRAEAWNRHSVREGFRLARARQEGELVGFAYGYTPRRGQWWIDHVTRARPREIGDQLLEGVCAGLTQERWLLTTTADGSDPAKRLYARHGWSVLGRGIAEGTVVMGRVNPAGAA